VTAATVFSAGCSVRANREDVHAVKPATAPSAPDLSTPESAVRAYTDWISYAYRLADSQVATRAFTADEEVRVNSYVELNRQRGRAIEMRLEKARYRTLSATGTTSTVVGSEEWIYRYISVNGDRYLTKPKQASYEVTYTLIALPGGRWLVDTVRVEDTKN
jgi:hypothetical protein